MATVNAEEKSGSVAALPPTQLVIRDKSGIRVLEGPIASETSTGITHSLVPVPFVEPSAALRCPPLYNPHGSVFCLLHERSPISLHNSSSGAKLLELDVLDAQKAYFSPLGTYLVTWSAPTKIGDTPIANLRLWSTSTGALLASYVSKTFKLDALQWTASESFAFRQGSNEVYVYGTAFSNDDAIAKVQHRGFTQFKIAAITGTTNVHVAVFNPESGGKPAVCSVYVFRSATAAVDGPVTSRTIFGASEATMMWNSTGSSLLIHSHSDVDSSNASYYGATALYLIHPQSNLSIKVDQSKDGPVQDVKWSPTGTHFVAIAGNVPSAASLYNEKGEAVFHFGAAHRNTISWSPHGRFVCLAGFGNLAGEMDFYDVIRLKKLGSNVSHCATTYGWAADSRSFLTASLAPRMNVDNNVKVFKYNGAGPLVHVQLERAFDAFWIPAPLDRYPNRPPSPRRGHGGNDGEVLPPAPLPTPLAPVAAYRPPGSTGSLSSFMARGKEQQVPVGKVPKETATQKYVPPAQKRSIPGMAPTAAAAGGPGKKATIPGAPPAGNASSVSAAKSTAGSAGRATGGKPPATATAAAAAAPEAAAGGEERAPIVDKDKRKKAVEKKLKQIEELHAKVSAGQRLDAEQTKKLETEAALRAELQSLA